MNKDEMIIDEDEIVESMKTYERARQETAREIFQALKKQGIIYSHFDRDDHLVITMDRLKALAQKYGIELED